MADSVAEHPREGDKTYWVPWETINEGNPQYILERKEHGPLPPLLIMQGGLDDNVLPSIQEKFVASWRAAGGDARLEIVEGCGHEWVAKPGPITDKAHEMVKSFIGRNLGAVRRPRRDALLRPQFFVFPGLRPRVFVAA